MSFGSRQKEGAITIAPLSTLRTSKPASVFAKYKTINKNRVLPLLSNQKMNAYLHEISDICGVNKKMTYHTARHTFATTVTLTNGVHIETVSKMLGHRNLKTTQRYAKILDKKVSEDMRALHQKFTLNKVEIKTGSDSYQ